jgi:heme/copper-type cytochrome/quinol oxidase subunit 2
VNEPLKDGLYIALCLIAPIVWGVISARIYDMAEAKRKARLPQPPAPVESADMYEI